jgi:hypothetical protein
VPALSKKVAWRGRKRRKWGIEGGGRGLKEGRGGGELALLRGQAREGEPPGRRSFKEGLAPTLHLLSEHLLSGCPS